MAIFITGDTHGNFSRLGKGTVEELENLTKDDYVIICGDFGGVWSKDRQEGLDFLEQRPFTTLFVSGNHENYELLATYPINQWHGGQVQFIRPSVVHLMRGQVFDLKGKRFFTMGGASSHDISDGILEPEEPDFEEKFWALYQRHALFRVNHQSWWKEELPSEAEYQTARENLDKCGWKVNYILTHCAPTSVQKALLGDQQPADALTDFLEEVRQKCLYDCWFFGHYHDNGVVGKNHILLYEEVVRVQ